MAQFVEAPTKTFTASAAVVQGVRVKFASGKVATAGVADDWIGVAETAAAADGDLITVRLRSAQGTSKFLAAGAITAGARVYAAASGKVDDVVTTELIGIAMPLAAAGTSAAGADGDVCEVLMIPGMGGGKRCMSGEVTLDGSNPTTVATGLNTITSANVTLKTATAPGDDPSWVSVNYSGSDGNLDVYAWKNTGGTDPTLVASTNSSAVFCWYAEGT